MKIILEYDPVTSMVTLPDGYQHVLPAGIPVDKYEVGAPPVDIVQLVSLGVNADELLKLKTNGII